MPPAEDIALAALHGGVFVVVDDAVEASRHANPAVPMAVFTETEMLFVPIWALIVLDEQPWRRRSFVGGTIIFAAAIISKALLNTRAHGR